MKIFELISFFFFFFFFYSCSSSKIFIPLTFELKSKGNTTTLKKDKLHLFIVSSIFFFFFRLEAILNIRSFGIWLQMIELIVLQDLLIGIPDHNTMAKHNLTCLNDIFIDWSKKKGVFHETGSVFHEIYVFIHAKTHLFYFPCKTITSTLVKFRQ